MGDDPRPGITWLSKAVVLAVHEEQLAEHGGAVGLRDEGLAPTSVSVLLTVVALMGG